MNRMQQSVESTQAIAESDAIAVERTLAGDRDAYRVLVERHSHTVFRLAYRMTGNRHDAEEVVQEAFLRGYQKLGQFAARSNFGTWVYRIAANYAIDRMRQRQKEEARREAPRAETGDGMENDPLKRVQAEAPTPERLTQSLDVRTAGGLPGVPQRVGTNRSSARGAGYAVCAGSGRRLRAAGVEADCSAFGRETRPVVADLV